MIPRWLLALILALPLAGCGEEQPITVSFEEARPAPAVPAGDRALASGPGEGQGTPAGPATAVDPKLSPTVGTGATAVATAWSGQPGTGLPPVVSAATSSGATARPARVLHGVAIFVDAPFFPSVEVSLTSTRGVTGPAPVHDLASRDGVGKEGRLANLVPDSYLLRLSTATLPGYTLHEQEVVVDGHAGTSVVLGVVQFELPKQGAAQMLKGIRLELLEQESRKPVFKGPLEAACVLDSGGVKHPRTLILPLGSYDFALQDLDPKDGVSITPSGGRPGLVLAGEGNSFKLGPQQRRTIVDLRPVLAVK
ncbi:MAG: hypothetical protein HY814_11430 [Candidatus Riflebacteria bacterium]|nr:hypothetical protein [Candidatus Riflebacteria bacterium]